MPGPCSGDCPGDKLRIHRVFALYALLGPDSPARSADDIAAGLSTVFRHDENVTVELERLPFSRGQSVTLRRGTWLARLTYEQGDQVQADSRYAQAALGTAAPPGLANRDKRIRAVFGDDDDRTHTNETIIIMDYLRAIDDVILFDPQRSDTVT